MWTIERAKAMGWWNGLGWSNKVLLMTGKFQNRHPQSLTGSEIEWLWFNGSNNLDMLRANNTDKNEKYI